MHLRTSTFSTRQQRRKSQPVFYVYAIRLLPEGKTNLIRNRKDSTFFLSLSKAQSGFLPVNKHHPLSAAKGQIRTKASVSASPNPEQTTLAVRRRVVANPEKDELSVFWLSDWDWRKHTGHWDWKHTLQTNSKCKTTVLLQYTGVLSSAALIACQAHQHMEGLRGGGKGGNRLAPKKIPWSVLHEMCGEKKKKKVIF